MRGTGSAQVLRPTTKSGCLTDYSSPKWPRVYSFSVRALKWCLEGVTGQRRERHTLARNQLRKALKKRNKPKRNVWFQQKYFPLGKTVSCTTVAH